MKRLVRRFRRHFGPSSPRVVVRTELQWHWKALLALMFVLLGFLIGHWHYAGWGSSTLLDELERLDQENKDLRTQAIHVVRQQQVSTVAQSDLAKDLAAIQEENVRLKEDVAFYKSILEESSGAPTVKFHSFKVTHGGRAGVFQYRLLLSQSGRHDRNVQGKLQLQLIGTQGGKSVSQVVPGGKDKINFKYYQPIEGNFRVPEQMSAHSLQAIFFQAGSPEPKLTQEITLPN